MRRALIVRSVVAVATGGATAFAEEVCATVELKNPAAPLTRPATWYISYRGQEGKKGASP